MKLSYKGKTKDVYKLDDGNILLKFKDDVTGTDGVFDPGANTVGLTVVGTGKSGVKMTHFFYPLIEADGITTHYIDANINEATLKVKDALMFGSGIEVICRYKAVGSFYRRYGAYCDEGQSLDGFIEVTLKDDAREDPPVSEDALDMLQIVEKADYQIIKKLTKQISDIVKKELAKKEMELYDIKLEFGRNRATGEIMLIDEISGGNMRVFKAGQNITPMEIEENLLE